MVDRTAFREQSLVSERGETTLLAHLKQEVELEVAPMKIVKIEVEERMVENEQQEEEEEEPSMEKSVLELIGSIFQRSSVPLHQNHFAAVVVEEWGLNQSSVLLLQ